MRIRKIAAAVIMCVIISCLPAFGLLAADTSVIYAGQADRFVFLPDEDLFDNFKNVVPGDNISQNITVRNTSNRTVEIFLRAESVEPQFVAFLEEINLSVTVEANPNQLWYDDSAADMGTTGMTVNRSLGNFRPGADLDITVGLSIPITWGNRFQGGYGEVVWVFTVIEDDPYIPPFIPPITPPPYIPPPVQPPYVPPYTPPPITPDTEYSYDITKPVPGTEPPETPAETVPVTEPEIIVIEDVTVPLGPAVTEAPLPPDDVPPTGDEAQIIIWCVSAVLLTLLLTVLIYFRRREDKEDKGLSGK